MKREAVDGMGDNLFWEVMGNVADDRERDALDYLFSAGTGAAMGGLSSPAYSVSRAKAKEQYFRWLHPVNYSEQRKERIRNAQNNTSSDLETFSKTVNENKPFWTTSKLYEKAEKELEAMGWQRQQNLDSPATNAPVENATLSDFQRILEKNLYEDNTGNLSHTEKDLVLKNFFDDVSDMLLGNSPSLKAYMEENSKKVLGHPMAYLDNKEFVDLALARYNLSPREMDMLRKAFQNKTNKIIPSKPGYVRAGEDNRNAKEYSDILREEIDSRPETLNVMKYNKKWSAAQNREEIIGQVLKEQSKGGVMGWYFPYFELNPEVKPLAFNNKALRYRNAANQATDAIIGYVRQPKEEKDAVETYIAGILDDARKLGLKSEKEISEFIISKLQDRQPRGETIGYSSQKKGER